MAHNPLEQIICENGSGWNDESEDVFILTRILQIIVSNFGVINWGLGESTKT
jgi:hypothetical protein